MNRTARIASFLAAPLLAAAPACAAPSAQSAASAADPVTFLDAARQVTAAIQSQYWLPSRKLYASEPGGNQVEMMWGNGIMFSALVAAARHEPRTYRPILSDFFHAMDAFWDTAVAIPGYEPAPTRGGGNDKYYDDNAWMVITYLEAFELTGDRKYHRRAEETQRFVLSGWDEVLGGGIYWHERQREGKNTCSNAPTAVGALLLARHQDRATHLNWARRITAWTHDNLQDQDALFFDSKKIPSQEIDRGKLTYNTALMLRANLGLWRATGDEAYLREAKRIGDNCNWFLSDQTGAYRDPPKWAHLQVEADLELYRATGDQAALARARRNGQVWFEQWQQGHAYKFIDIASVARALWLLADHETPVGQAFWKRSDALGTFTTDAPR